jgi:fructokinase
MTGPDADPVSPSPSATPSARSSRPPLAVGIGEVLWDLLPGGKQLGGAPANFAYHAQQLGAQSAVVSAVGRDPLGDEILARLRELGIDTRYVAIDPQHPTGTVSVKLDAARVPSYVIHEIVAWDRVPDSPALHDLARSADVICFGSLAQRSPHTKTTIHECLRAARPDALRICDINLRQNYFSERVIADSLHLANVLKLNDQELPVIARQHDLPENDEEAVVRVLLEKLPLRVIALTRGDKGSSLYTRNETNHHPGFATKLADTVGAGDSFMAALAIGLLRGEPLERINDAANRLAAYVCSKPGATPPIPAELRASLWG